jgi:Flp pilus assembly CpaE family ATPase
MFRDPQPDSIIATTKFKKLSKKELKRAMPVPAPSVENAPTDRGQDAPLFLDADLDREPDTLDPPGIVQTPAPALKPPGPPPIPADARSTPSMLDLIAPTRYTPPAIPIPDPPPLHPVADPLYRTPAVGWVAPPPPPAAEPAPAEEFSPESVDVYAPPTVEPDPAAVDHQQPEVVFSPAEPAHASAPEPQSEPEPEPEPVSQAEPAAAPVADPQKRGKVILLFGCRGGSGSTTLAVNIAAAMARQEREVCLVDLDLQLGDVFVSLDLDSKITLAHMAREAPLMDAAALRRRLPRHESGVYALSQAGRVDDIDPGLVDQVPTLLHKLACHFDVVLIDGVRDFGDFALAALDAADEIALVFTQDVPSVRRAGRIIQVCRKLGYPDRKLRLVLNRFTGDSKVNEDEIERALSLPVLARVANDYRATRRAQDDGVLLTDVAGRTKITRDMRHLAEALLDEAEAPVRKKGGLFSRFLGGR